MKPYFGPIRTDDETVAELRDTRTESFVGADRRAKDPDDSRQRFALLRTRISGSTRFLNPSMSIKATYFWMYGKPPAGGSRPEVNVCSLPVMLKGPYWLSISMMSSFFLVKKSI